MNFGIGFTPDYMLSGAEDTTSSTSSSTTSSASSASASSTTTSLPASTSAGAADPVTTTSTSASDDRAKKIGIGVGLGVGIPLTLAALAALWLLRRERQRRLAAERSVAPQVPTAEMVGHAPYAGLHTGYHHPGMQNLADGSQGGTYMSYSTEPPASEEMASNTPYELEQPHKTSGHPK